FDTWHPRIVILDPHNEYTTAFKENCSSFSTDNGSLKLPYWLLSLEELCDLLLGKAEFTATTQKNIVKKALLECRKKSAVTFGIDEDKITIDSPIPFKISEFKDLIDQDRIKLTESKQDSYKSLLNKLDSLNDDARYNFLMEDWKSGKDDVTEVIKQFISNDTSIHIIDLSGIPNEVAGIISSVIARTLFNFKVWETADER